MIFKTETEKDVVQIGEIKNNNVSIDTSNIDFIVTILSTNLYSKPIESFIRETVSNAWDSHVEAGVDEPVILELGESTEGNYYCRIQDFGVGLSPERFNTIYKNIGSSTKRGDNTQIGGFGIGRFSALAYSDVVHITSNYEGKKYQYMMYKDGNSISIDLLHEQDTHERNGLEVKLDIESGDFKNFANAVKTQLVYFENLYVVDSTNKHTDFSDRFQDNYQVKIEEEYNNFSIKKYDNFWVNSLDAGSKINLVLGKVRYPLRISSLDEMYSTQIENYPISLIFDIGDLEVTPNREEILYSTKNKTAIQHKLNAALEEIGRLIDAEGSKDFTKLSEYIEAIKENSSLVLLEDENKPVKIKLPQSKKNITFKNESFNGKDFLFFYNTLMSQKVVTSTYQLDNEQIRYLQKTMSFNAVKTEFSSLYSCDVSLLKNISKRYIREVFTDGAKFIPPTRTYYSLAKKLITSLKNYEVYTNKGYTNQKFKYDSKAFKIIYRHVATNLSRMSIFNDNLVPKKWIEDTKAADRAKRKQRNTLGFDWSQNVNLHIIREKDYGGGLMTDSKATPMKDLHKKFKKLTVYGEKENKKLRALYNYCKSGVRPNLVELAPTKVKMLDNIENFVNIEDFMSTEYKLIQNIATVEYLKRNFPKLIQINSISNIESISVSLADTIRKLANFVDTYGNERVGEEELITEIFELCENENMFNKSIVGLFEDNKKELLNSEVLLLFADTSSPYGRYTTSIDRNRVNLAVDYLLARKLIRPSLEAVNKLKEETIYNVIKEKENESN